MAGAGRKNSNQDNGKSASTNSNGNGNGQAANGGDGRKNNGRVASATRTGGTARQTGSSKQSTPGRRSDGRFSSQSAPPTWVTAVIGVGVAVAAGLFATRKQWMPKTEEWRDDFSAAFADDETDYENFDQTRNAGTDAMRDHPGDDWEDIDEMSDASFPASDPPAFTPGRA